MKWAYKFRLLLTKLLLPFIRFISKLGKPEPLLTVDDYWKINSLLAPGDVLLCTEYYRLSNILVKGFWTHAAIYVGDGWVFEAVPNKCRTVHISQFVLTKDAISVRRPTFRLLKPHKLLDFALNHNGKPYDFSFTPESDAWYCSEAVWNLLKLVAHPPMPFQRRKTWGVETVTPEDYLCEQNFIRTYEKIGKYKN